MDDPRKDTYPAEKKNTTVRPRSLDPIYIKYHVKWTEIKGILDYTGLKTIYLLLGDPEVTANIYCKSRNLPNTNT